MRIAIDAMGGDHAPGAILQGCLDALPLLDRDDRLILVGDPGVIGAFLDANGARDDRLVIEAAEGVIAMDEPPVEAVRQKPDASLVRLCRLAGRRAERPVDAVISAGNTGAMVSAATMHMRRLPGVHRPGIAAVLPSFGGHYVLCDVGANPEPRAQHLAQYAVMAETYAALTLGIERPRIAQLSIGVEAGKGTRLIREVRCALEQAPGLNYIGYVEGREIFNGAADVVVTDGFVGNALLKLSEGLAKSLLRAILREVVEFDPALAAKIQPLADVLKKKNDYQEYGAAPLLGVNGVCMICHGSSEPRSIVSAIQNTRTYLTRDVNGAIVARLADVGPAIDRVIAGQAQSAPEPA
ncbi:MAG: phosphate acyltransferase PlsX [Planctomycetota bacterium]|nr:MAG: phosphate acyltransferase PlsX [Planctomycetota bacterium]